VSSAPSIASTQHRALQRIVSDILEFSRVQELNREATAIDGWLDDMLDEHEVTPAVTVRRELGSGAEVRSTARASPSPRESDRQRAQAMTDPEWAPGDERQRTVTVRTVAAGRMSAVGRDTGPGIPADKLGKIFEPLFTTKPRESASACDGAQAVEQHGGTIDVESTAGDGTTFTVWLPRQHGQADLQPTPRLRLQPEEAIAMTSKPVRIMIVDDDQISPKASPTSCRSMAMTSILPRMGRTRLSIHERRISTSP